MSRKDVLGVEVEVGDLCLSAPKGKYSSKPYVGKVTNVAESGRVTLKHPLKRNIYAYERGAPDVEHTSSRYQHAKDENGNLLYEEDTYYGRPQSRPKYEMVPYTYMRKDYTVVAHEWTWVKSQGADINLFVLRKGEQKVGDPEDILGTNFIREALELDYETDKPDLP